MSKRRDRSPLVGDIERSHPIAADPIGDESGVEPLTVRLGDLWNDLIRVAAGTRDIEGPKGSSSAVPLLDDMKGILEWD